MIFHLMFGLFAIGLGLAVAFRGLSLFKVLLPFWAFFTGLSMGGAAVAALLGGNLFASMIGVVVGLVLGLVFAAFSYFAFGFAVMILGASLGWQLGVGFMGLFGLGSGILAFVAGLVLAIVMGISFMLWRMPRALVIVFTAMVGAITVISGTMVLFGVLSIQQAGIPVASEVISESTLWTAFWLALAMLGVVTQYQNEAKKEMLFKDFIIDDYQIVG